VAGSGSCSGQQAVPVAVARQLQQQAQDLIRLQRQVAHLQVSVGVTGAGQGCGVCV
jgi:hypothetical protein